MNNVATRSKNKTAGAKPVHGTREWAEQNVNVGADVIGDENERPYSLSR
jgi:hypothetical protein